MGTIKLYTVNSPRPRPRAVALIKAAPVRFSGRRAEPLDPKSGSGSRQNKLLHHWAGNAGAAAAAAPLVRSLLMTQQYSSHTLLNACTDNLQHGINAG